MKRVVPTSYHLDVAAVHAAAQPGQLHTAASAARAAEQDWRRISGSYVGATAPEAEGTESASSGAIPPPGDGVLFTISGVSWNQSSTSSGSGCHWK